MKIDPSDEDYLFRKTPKKVQELAKRARARRRMEERSAFSESVRGKTQKGLGW